MHSSKQGWLCCCPSPHEEACAERRNRAASRAEPHAGAHTRIHAAKQATRCASTLARICSADTAGTHESAGSAGGSCSPALCVLPFRLLHSLLAQGAASASHSTPAQFCTCLHHAPWQASQDLATRLSTACSHAFTARPAAAPAPALLPLAPLRSRPARPAAPASIGRAQPAGSGNQPIAPASISRASGSRPIALVISSRRSITLSAEYRPSEWSRR